MGGGGRETGWWPVTTVGDGSQYGPRQRGIVTYSLSQNRQKPLGGALSAAVFNTWRRSKAQILYWLPPLVGAYYIWQWAENRTYWYSKEGRQELKELEAKKTAQKEE